MSSQPVAKPQTGFSITVLNGPEKGTVYQLAGGEISLGRGRENDIAFPEDPKCSRRHATLVIGPTGAYLKDVSKRNKLTVNGVDQSETALTHNATITLGQTELQFKVAGMDNLPAAMAPAAPNHGASPQQSHLQLAPNFGGPGVPQSPTFQANPSQPQPGPRARRDDGGKKKRFYIILITIISIGAWLATSNTNKKIQEGIRFEDQINDDISKAKTEAEKITERKRQQGHFSTQYQQAQTHYIRGFRDYEQGQYERAISSFQTCLSLFPRHIACQRYSTLARKKFDELVQYNMHLGTKYLKQGQYKACMSAFQNVMVMVRDNTSPKYKEARQILNDCKSLQRGGI